MNWEFQKVQDLHVSDMIKEYSDIMADGVEQFLEIRHNPRDCYNFQMFNYTPNEYDITVKRA
jgi:hypothetical protein